MNANVLLTSVLLAVGGQACSSVQWCPFYETTPMALMKNVDFLLKDAIRVTENERAFPQVSGMVEGLSVTKCKPLAWHNVHICTAEIISFVVHLVCQLTCYLTHFMQSSRKYYLLFCRTHPMTPN